MAAFRAFQDESIASPDINQFCYSISGNLKWDPVSNLRQGVEYMHGYRELLGGTMGAFHRLQFAAKYIFGYQNSTADEKR